MATKAKNTVWGSGHDEFVEVNQRALIDKILARYFGEFTVFRELLQNADDASAAAVEIRFETKNYIDGGKVGGGHLPPLQDEDLKTTPVDRWTLKNNGFVFREQDWDRLKKIAEGNPDEEKIGAFGVGFYSVFSVTEGPFVMSGGQWMGFHWKDKRDQLFARRGSLPKKTGDPWTVFEMDLREPAPMPDVFDFARFLVSAITFKVHLRQVSVYFNDKRLVHLTKNVGSPKQIPIPQGLKPNSTMGFMNIKGLQATPLHITAEVMGHVYKIGTNKTRQVSVAKKKAKPKAKFLSFFASNEGSSTSQQAPSIPPLELPTDEVDLEPDNSGVELTIFTANVDVKLSSKISAELHRSMRKNPPRTLKYELIYTGKDAYDASKKGDDAQSKLANSVFQGIRADLEGSDSARIFIGHVTSQTTGIGGHMSARFIPTVERESIDLVDKNVAIWNKELLYVGGFLARAVYELEMQDMKVQWNASIASNPGQPLDPELRKRFYDQSCHNLQFFAFHESTPSPIVSRDMKSAFFNCVVQGQPFPIVSSAGVRSALDVRLPNSALSPFLKNIPIFPEEVYNGSRLTVANLQLEGMLKDITFEDVIEELRGRSLSEDEMVSCLKWWTDMFQRDPTGIHRNRRQFLGAGRLTIGSPDDERTIHLKGVQTFLNRQNDIFPADGPLPTHLLPITISKKFDATQLQDSLRWRELTVVEWVRHIVDPAVCNQRTEFNIVEGPVWAERVLQVLTKSWPSLSKVNKSRVAKLLSGVPCIPTSSRMEVPNKAYFSSAAIFHDLPIVSLPSGTAVKGNLEGVLVDLGVRKHVDLTLVCSRMLDDSDWTIPDLIKYLASIQSTLHPTILMGLRHLPAFHEEATTETSFGIPKKVKKYRACDLYEPLDIFRQLGLPVIDWQGKHGKHRWRAGSDEAKFLFTLGLIRCPPTKVILGIAAKGEPQGPIALNFFLENALLKYTDYNPKTYANLAFVPAILQGEKRLAKPLEVSAGPDWQMLGFPVLDPALGGEAAYKLKVKEHPPTSQLVNLLKTSPPTTNAQASDWFGLLSRRTPDFHHSELTKLSSMSIVPALEGSKYTGPLLVPPNQCYFKGGSHQEFYSRLFAFVDFGTSANSFLSACGTKEEPSVEDIAQLMSKDPHKFFELIGGQENYLSELRKLATNTGFLTSATLSKLKKAEVLIGCRRIRRPRVEKVSDPMDEDGWDMEYRLLPPNQIAIADDMLALQQFGEGLSCAPQEAILEGLYRHLGCKQLSDLVQEEYQTVEEIQGHKTAQEVRALVLERLPIFLHEHTYVVPQVSLAWLNNERNFVVRTFRKVITTRSINFPGAMLSKSFLVSAVSRQKARGEIQLWLAWDMQVDMYEVATSLCRLLFKTHKVIDALFFMTMLSMDRHALQRRGYNVQRILKRQAERDAVAIGPVKERKRTGFMIIDALFR